MTEESGPPGSRIFTLEGRPAPSLYLLGWLVSGIGLAVIFVALLSSIPSVSPIIASVGVVVLGLGLSFAAGYQIVARASRPIDAYRGPSPLILFGIVLCASTVITGLLVAAGLDPEEPGGFLISIGLIGLSYLGVVALFVVRSGALRWSEMGWPAWQRGDAGRLARVAQDVAFAALLIVPTTFAAVLGGGVLAMLLQVEPASVLPPVETSVQVVAVSLAAAVIAPLGEELFFRGFALTAWWRDLGPRSALIRSSAFFALVHIANVQADTFGQGLAQAAVQVAVILPLGLVIGFLFQQRGMAAAITAHVGYNALLLVLFFVAQGAGAPAG